MHPVLFEIPLLGGLRIYTYGVLVAAAFLAGILWTTREARLAGIDKEKILDLSFTIILAALIGSRILYILVDWKHYLRSPLDILKVWEGGLIFYGGLIGAILASFFYLKKHRLKFLKVADLFMPGLALGHAIGRLGCLAAGCCHGREAPTAWWALTFPEVPYSLAPTGIPLYPSQLMEAAASLLIFFLLLAFRRNKRFDGQIFLLYLIFSGLARAGLELFRGAEARSLLLPWFSTSQLISLLLVVGAAIFYRYYKQTEGTP